MNPTQPTPADLVAGLRQDLDELKGRQLVGWDSFAISDVSTGAAFDLSKALAANASQSYDITLTYSKAKAGAMVELNPFFRVDNPAVMALPDPRSLISGADLAIWWQKTASGDTSATWRLSMMNRSTTTAHTGYVKLFFEGTDTGSFSIVPV